MDYLLDTNIVSSLMEQNQAAMRHVDRLGPSDNLYASVVTEGELRFGALMAPALRAPRIRREVEDILSALSAVVPITRAAGEAYGDIRYDITARGVPLPDNDVWIAAVALANDYILVSHDSGFARILRLQLEDWLA